MEASIVYLCFALEPARVASSSSRRSAALRILAGCYWGPQTRRLAGGQAGWLAGCSLHALIYSEYGTQGGFREASFMSHI